ncbi:lysostaphin resistance A-like protein [Specibacter sp. AOP5-B1-6]|uniref:lysostaphin resistance A-like protein n=1 Tax=Specibacter sp. AOP5-B1-6 TaxID=3457653 RepID=UPI00402B0807
MNQRTNIIPPDVEYHRVLAGEKRRIGRGILAIMLLIGGMMFFSLVLAAIAAAVNAAMGVDGPAANNPLIYATGMLSLALLIPWSMLIQRWLYGVKGASLHSVVSWFRFDIFGRALVIILPAWLVYIGVQYLAPGSVPEGIAWTNTNVLLFILATLLLTPFQAAGEEYGFRGLIFRVAGGWARGARSGLVVGILVSAVAFAFIHLSTDPWLNVHYVIFAVGTALITWRTGGIEIAVVLHAGINTLVLMMEAALRQDFQAAVDRSAGVGEISMILAPALVIILTTVVAFIITWRRGPARTPALPSQDGEGNPARSGMDTPLGRTAAPEETGARTN